MKSSPELIIGVSGARGIVGPGINPAVAVRLTTAFAAPLRGGLVAVGRDTRPSGPMLASAVFSTLRFLGCDVVDLGVCSTPTVEIMVRELGAAGGVIITASHNGAEWNALKFLDAAGEFYSAAAMDAIAAGAADAESRFERGTATGSFSIDENAEAVHMKRILDLPCIDGGNIAGRGFRIAVDCVNGAGSRIMPALLRSLGVSVIELFTDVTAPFPHDPEPRPANLGDLARAVVREKADAGFACDPDADRLVFVDGAGTVCSEELTLAVAADFVLARERGPLVANLSSSRVLDDIGRKHGVPVLRAKVGEANVIALMKESGAVVGGEGNGGVIYPRLHYGRDAMLGAALALQALADEGVTLAEKVESYPRYHIVKDKLAFAGDFDEVRKSAEKRFSGSVNAADGIRIDMEKGWIHLRRSNTEPVVRVIAEATSAEEAQRLASDAARLFS